MELKNYFPPFEDELLYGWATRLARANAFPQNTQYPMTAFIQTFFSKYADGHIPDHPGCDKPKYDFFRNLNGTYERMNAEGLNFPLPPIAMQRNTIYPAMYPITTKGTQARIAETILRPVTGGPFDMPNLPNFITKLKVCPDCYREDGKHPYYRTWHQFPGIRKCAKHDVPLLAVKDEFIGKEYLGGSNMFSFQDQSLSILCDPLPDQKDKGTEYSYAWASYSLYNKSITYDKITVRKLLINRARQYYNDPFDYMVRNLATYHYGAYFDHRPSQRIERYRNNTTLSYEETIALICCVYNDNADDFAHDLADASRNYDMDFYPLKCKCGHKRFAHSLAVENGIPCPYCGDGVTPEDNASYILSKNGDSEYELEGRFAGMGSPISIRHKTCRKMIVGRPSEWFWENKACSCERCVNIKTAQEKVDSMVDDYIVSEYIPSTKTVVLRHLPCNTTRKMLLSSVNRNIKCPVCSFLRKQEREVQELLGDEYRIVNFEGTSKPITFRHSLCNTISRHNITEIRNGCKCSLCTPRSTSKRNNGQITTDAKVYLQIKEHCQFHKVWVSADHPEKPSGRERDRALCRLKKRGLISSPSYGVYTTRIVSASDVITEKYLIANEMVVGSFKETGSNTFEVVTGKIAPGTHRTVDIMGYRVVLHGRS